MSLLELLSGRGIDRREIWRAEVVAGETPASAAGVGVGDPSGPSPPGDDDVQAALCHLLRLEE
jgi:hypothetical protein